RRADVGFESVKRQRAPQRQDLRHDAEHHFLHAARAGRADAFDRSWIDGLDRFGKQLREHPEIVNENGHDAGEGARPTATTNISAKTISLMARQASIRRRTGCTIHCGQTLAALRIENGMPNATASAVPHIAICTVTTMSARYWSHS